MTQHMSLEEFKASRAAAEAAARSKSPRTGAKKPIDREGQEQTKVFNWLNGEEMRRGEFAGINSVTYHVPNGGERNARVGAKLKEQGARAGVVDIFCDSARGGYFGLRIEMKANRPHNAHLSEQQYKRMTVMRDAGYCVLLCLGADEAIAALSAYWKWPLTVPSEPPKSTLGEEFGTDWSAYPIDASKPRKRARKSTRKKA